MKNIIKVLLLLIAVSPAGAQDLKMTPVYYPYDYGKEGLGVIEEKSAFKKLDDIAYNQYELDGKSYIEVANCVAGSDVAFYSGKSGGTVVKTVTADKSGRIIFEQPKSFNPAFVVNLKNKSRSGAAGNGMVNFNSVKLFSLKDVTLEKNANSQTVISWRAQVNFDNAVIDIQKSTDGENFKTIGSVPFAKTGSLNNASFVDEKGGPASYRLMLVNKNTNSSYLTNPVQLEPLAGFTKIYPSPTNDNINVTLAGGQQGSYLILDNAGKTIKQGKLSQKSSRIAVKDLANGIYFIKITTADNKTETKQFIKN